MKGKIVWSDFGRLILAVNGVGYEVLFKNNFTYLDLDSELALFITQKISEYGETMYGFKTREEKAIFESLDTIKGIGSKVIYTVMSELELDSYSKLQDIPLERLVKLPGVGKNTAQKFLLGLSTKLKKEFDLKKIHDENKAEYIETQYKGEVDLLVSWGMKKTDILSFLRNNQDKVNEISSEELIKLLLQKLK